MSTIDGHKLNVSGQVGDLAGWHWWCECGRWESPTPKVGPWGLTTAKARIAQVNMAHGKHARFALFTARKATA